MNEPRKKPISPKPNAPRKPPSGPVLSLPPDEPLDFDWSRPPDPQQRFRNQPAPVVVQFPRFLGWASVLALGLLLILIFEAGFSLGRSRVNRMTPTTDPVPTAVAAAAPAATPAESKVASVPPSVPTGAKPLPPATSNIENPRSEPTQKAPPKMLEPPPKAAPPLPRPEPPKPIPPEPSASDPARTKSLTFAKDVQPIFQAKCANCHGGLSKKAGLDVRTLASLMQGRKGSRVLVPGDPSRSSLWVSIESGEMPPPGKSQLTAVEKNLIRDWIAGGAK